MSEKRIKRHIIGKTMSIRFIFTKMITIRRIFGFLTFICCTINEINGFQRFAEQPKYSEVNPGQDALLTCKIIDKRGTCSWQKDNKPVGIYPKKYEWAGSTITIHQSLQPPHIGGDCSLWIRSATLDFDDGLWECQVTASDFTTQDALTSQPVRLVVRVAPQRPRLEHEGVHVPPGHNVTVDSGAVATVKCISHYGNPPAVLKWFLGNQEISPLRPQINTTEPDNPRTWSAASVVQVPATRERHGEMLKCMAFHESYVAKSVTVEARMDIKYAPTIRLHGAPQIELEEGKDVLILRCEADANPPASIVWRRAGRSEIASLQESLQLRPVGRRDAGLYTCQAQNSVGSSEQLSIQLDVKYPPRIVTAGPDYLTTAPLFSPAAFECVAEGNPPPTYKWVQRLSQGSKFLERGHDSRLIIDNVTYDYQGEYECRATNFINGQERTVTSEPVSLQVVGAPQVLRLNPSMHSVSVKKGESASLSLVVCADPRPRHVAWEWGSLRLEAGAGIGRYRVDEVTQDSREDCYLATLHISDTDIQDSRPYYLVVENERGTDRHAIHLNVEGTFSEPLEISYLLGIAGGCLAALLILICLCIYAVRAKKCCFKGRSGYKSSDKDSEKADLKSRSDSTSGPQGDSIYTTPAGFHHHHHQHTGQGSPEAMKSTTLQNDVPMWQHQHTRSGSAGTKIIYPTSTGTGKNADLVLGTQRHQRDLFTGDLGIPEITTRVGSVIHAFETMAMLRRESEKPYEPDEQNMNNSKYGTSSGKRKSQRSSRGKGSQSKYSHMKKKSNESRHKIALASSLSSPNQTISKTSTLRAQHNSPSTYPHSDGDAGGGRGGGGDRQLSSGYYPDATISNGHLNEVPSSSYNQFKHHHHQHNSHYLNDNMNLSVEDNYRKNLFGTQPKQKRSYSIKGKTLATSRSGRDNRDDNNKLMDVTNGDDIVNKAFNGIFDDDDDDDNDNGDNNNNKKRQNLNRNDNELNNNIIRRSSKSHKFDKSKRSSTLSDIFEFTKCKTKSITKYPSTSSTMLCVDKPKFDFNYNQHQHHQQQQPNHQHHHQFQYHQKESSSSSHQEKLTDDNENFVRGTTISQSFIKNVKNGIDGKTDAINYSKTHDGNFVMSNSRNISGICTGRRGKHPPAAVAMNQQKRSKSSSEIVDELQRKYFHENLDRFETRTSREHIDDGTIGENTGNDDDGSGVGTDVRSGGGGFRSSKRSAFRPKATDRAEI